MLMAAAKEEVAVEMSVQRRSMVRGVCVVLRVVRRANSGGMVGWFVDGKLKDAASCRRLKAVVEMAAENQVSPANCKGSLGRLGVLGQWPL